MFIMKRGLLSPNTWESLLQMCPLSILFPKSPRKCLRLPWSPKKVQHYSVTWQWRAVWAPGDQDAKTNQTKQKPGVWGQRLLTLGPLRWLPCKGPAGWLWPPESQGTGSDPQLSQPSSPALLGPKPSLDDFPNRGPMLGTAVAPDFLLLMFFKEKKKSKSLLSPAQSPGKLCLIN